MFQQSYPQVVANNPDYSNNLDNSDIDSEDDDGEWKQQFFVRLVEKVGGGFIIFYRQYVDDPESKTRCRDIFTSNSAGTGAGGGNIVMCSDWYKIDKSLFLDVNGDFLLAKSEHAESASSEYRIVSFMAKYKDAKIKHFIRSRSNGSLVAISFDNGLGQASYEVSFCPLFLPGILGTIVYTTIPPDSYTVIQKPQVQSYPVRQVETKLDYSPPMSILQTLTSIPKIEPSKPFNNSNSNNSNNSDDDDDFDVDLFLCSSLSDVSTE